MGGYINPFLSNYLPQLFWPAQLAVYGREVQYRRADAEPVPLAVLWKEGESDEEVSPGRYSHMDIRDADLAAPPAKRDAVLKDDTVYEVVRVSARAVGFSTIVLQLSTEDSWQCDCPWKR